MEASEVGRFMKRSVLRLDIAREGLNWKGEWQNVVCMVQWGVECCRSTVGSADGKRRAAGWQANSMCKEV